MRCGHLSAVGRLLDSRSSGQLTDGTPTVFRRLLYGFYLQKRIDTAPHAFSRGAAQELKECGPPWSAVASAGLWRFPDFWGYLDMARDVEAPAQDRFEVAPDSDSDPGQD